MPLTWRQVVLNDSLDEAYAQLQQTLAPLLAEAGPVGGGGAGL